MPTFFDIYVWWFGWPIHPKDVFYVFISMIRAQGIVILECVGIVGEMTDNYRLQLFILKMYFSAFILPSTLQYQVHIRLYTPRSWLKIWACLQQTCTPVCTFHEQIAMHTYTLLFWPSTSCDTSLKIKFLQYWLTVNLRFFKQAGLFFQLTSFITICFLTTP